MTRVNTQSRFIEMFGNPVTNTKKWLTEPLEIVAPESPSENRELGQVWILNLDMVESQSGRVIEKVYDCSDNLNSVSPFDKGNVLFSKLRPYLNKVVIPDGNGYATTELVPLRPNETKMKRTFLAYLLRSDDFVGFADSIATGTKMPRMPMQALRSFECILPPIQLQEEFIGVAEQADKSKFSDFKSRFIAWCSEWKSHTTIRGLVETSLDKASRKFKPEDTIRYIDISSVDRESNSVIGTTEYRFSEAPSRAQQCTRKGDILVSTVRPNLKNIAVNQLDEDNLVASSGFCVLRPKEQYSGLILAYVLSEPFTQKMVAEAKGSNYPAIHDSDILDYPITVPESHELVRVVEFVQQADKSKYLN